MNSIVPTIVGRILKMFVPFFDWISVPKSTGSAKDLATEIADEMFERWDLDAQVRYGPRSQKMTQLLFVNKSIPS